MDTGSGWRITKIDIQKEGGREGGAAPTVNGEGSGHKIYEPTLPKMIPSIRLGGQKGKDASVPANFPLKIQGTSAHRPVQRGSGAAVGGMNAKA